MTGRMPTLISSTSPRGSDRTNMISVSSPGITCLPSPVFVDDGFGADVHSGTGGGMDLQMPLDGGRLERQNEERQ